MTRILAVFIPLWCLISAASFLVHERELTSVSDSKDDLQLFTQSRTLDNKWLDEFKKVPEFYTPPPPPPKQETKAEREARLEAEKLAAAKKSKPVSIKDAKLVGIINRVDGEILLILPKQQNTITMRIGETWLEPWQLAEIGNDYAVWQNTTEPQQFIQLLFKPN